MNFASDNAAAIAPPILDALVRANSGFALGYGNDALTRTLERRLCDVFAREVAVFLVTTGTAANALAIAHLTPPWGAVLCHEDAHIANDEAGAPEFFAGGVKLITLAGEGGKLAPATLTAALARGRGAPHAVVPTVLSLTQSTEAGTVYRNEEVRELATIAHAAGMGVHMDGARFANALVTLGCAAAEATWKAGVDALSFGATKGGALAAEAVIMFDPARAHGLASRRKRGGHLISKHRFLAAQFDAYLADDLWLRLARHANDAARALAQGLQQAGLPPLWPVQANEVFVAFRPNVAERLRAAGATFYLWPRHALPAMAAVADDDQPVRLVTSFATTREEVDAFVALAQRK